MKKIFLFLLCFLFSFLLCFKNSWAQDSSIIKSQAPKSAKKIVIKYGIASYYATKFSGRKTSSGSVYNSAKLTAACNVLPLGTWVKVTNLRNEKTVIVQINDHLHHKNKRLIDLSKSAAQKLGYISRGITRVKVEVLGELKKKNSHLK
ncbi:MAG: septal ring lytic transglycosylase RlpA family protein [Ginsengibacter sp.]